MNPDVDALLKSLLALRKTFFRDVSAHTFYLFFIGLFIFLLLIVRVLKNMLWFWFMCWKYLLHVCSLPLIFLMVSFEGQKILFW